MVSPQVAAIALTLAVHIAGAIILIGQLPRALGLPSPAQSHVFDVVTHIADLASRTLPGAVEHVVR